MNGQGILTGMDMVMRSGMKSMSESTGLYGCRITAIRICSFGTRATTHPALRSRTSYPARTSPTLRIGRLLAAITTPSRLIASGGMSSTKPILTSSRLPLAQRECADHAGGLSGLPRSN